RSYRAGAFLHKCGVSCRAEKRCPKDTVRSRFRALSYKDCCGARGTPAFQLPRLPLRKWGRSRSNPRCRQTIWIGGTCAVQPAFSKVSANSVPRRLVMKAWSVIGLLFAAAIFATIPISPQVTPRGVELSVNQAQAILGHWRRVNRRVYRRAYRRGYYYGGYAAPYYGYYCAYRYGAPYYYGRRYGYY